MIDSNTIFHLLGEWEIFKHLPRSARKVLSDNLSFVHYKSDKLILEQGLPSVHLFIVVSGKFDVLLDGLTINSIDQPGDTLGEISWITQEPASASVVARAESTSLFIPFDKLESLSQTVDNQIALHLWQVLPRMVINRLLKTNQKAKQVEALFDKLRTTEESLRLLNETLEHQLARRERDLFDKASLIAKMSLPNILNVISSAKNEKNKGLNESTVLHLESEVNGVQKALLDLIAPKKMQLEASSIIDVGLDSKSKTALNGVVRALGLESKSTDNGSIPDSLSINVFGNSEAVPPHFDLSSNKNILFLRSLSAHELDHIKTFNTFVYCPEEAKSEIVRTLTTSLNKVLFNNIWGLHKYLSWGTAISSHRISNSNKRLEQIDSIVGKMRNNGLRSSILSRMHLVLEELLMNAIYDAPTDGNGFPLFNHLSRNEEVALAPGHDIEIQYGTDGLLLGVSVADPFGSLTKEIIISYLKKNLQGQDSHSSSKGGAGKGLFMIVSNSDLTVFNIQKGRRTEVICLFELEKRARELPDNISPFHFYYSA